MGRGQKLGDNAEAVPFSDMTVEDLLRIVRSLPPEESAVAAVSRGLYYLDSRALAALLKELHKVGLSNRCARGPAKSPHLCLVHARARAPHGYLCRLPAAQHLQARHDCGSRPEWQCAAARPPSVHTTGTAKGGPRHLCRGSADHACMGRAA